MNLLRISNGRVIDPAQELDQIADVWPSGDRVLCIGPRLDLQAGRTIGARNRIVWVGGVVVLGGTVLVLAVVFGVWRYLLCGTQLVE